MADATMLTTSRPPRWRVFGIVFAVVSALMTCWVFATPLMAVPDEPAHAIRAAAVVRGQITAPPSEDFPWMMEARVPRYVAHSSTLTCFAFDPSIPASCQRSLEGDPDEFVRAATSAGPNSPLYYAIVGLPTHFLSGDAGLYGMRIVNALLTAGLLALAVMCLSQLGRARWVYAAAVAALTPMVLFLGGSINPNSIEIAAAAALFASLSLVVRQSSGRRVLWEHAFIVVASAWLLINTRSIALLWLVLILGIALVMSNPVVIRELVRRAATWVALGLSAAAALAAVYWYTRPQPSAPEGDLPPAYAMGESFITGVRIMIDRGVDYMAGWIGLFGWVDQPAPSLAIVIWTVALGAVIAAALLIGRGRTRLAVILLIAVSLVVPPIVQGILLADYGLIWQGRYMIAIYTCLVLGAGIALDDATRRRGSPTAARVVTVGFWTLAVGHVLTFVWVMRRYVMGVDSWLDMIRAPLWQPPLTWIGLTVVFSAILAGATLLGVRYLRPRLSDPGHIDDERPLDVADVSERQPSG